jgi:heme A synthase
MDQTRTTYDTTDAPPLAEDRIIDRPLTVGRTYAEPAAVETRVIEQERDVKDRVRWGPILGGVATTIASMLALSVLGIALGASVIDRAPGDDIETWAAIWGAGSAIVSFFLGGWVAGKSAAVAGTGTGMLNGFLVGCAAIALILWLTVTGAGNLFGAVGASLEDIQNVVLDDSAAATTNADTTDELRATFSNVEDDAWITLAVILLPLLAAALGGMVAHNERHDLVRTAA